MNIKRIIKNGLGIVIAIMLAAVQVFSLPVSAEEYKKHGYEWDSDYYNVSWKSKEYVKVYSEDGGLLGTMTYYVGVSRRKGTNDYILMTKETMTPNMAKVRVYSKGKSKYYGYGLSEYVSLWTMVPGDLGEYYPYNNPSIDELEFSAGASSDGPSVGLAYTIECSDLDITAKCNTTTSKFYMVYDYKPDMLWLPWWDNTYVSEESHQYGMAEFETTNKTIRFLMWYDARFGVSSNASRSPACIYNGKVYKTESNRIFTFTISK